MTLKIFTIHIKGADGRKNTTVIKATTGKLVSKETSNVFAINII